MLYFTACVRRSYDVMEIVVLKNLEHSDVPSSQIAAEGKLFLLLKSQSTVRYLAAFVFVAAALWAPRILKLNQFVTIDESKWLVRSANFYQAITGGSLVDTFQHGHPGVTIMFAGMAGYLWKFPSYIHVAAGQYRWEDYFMYFLTQQGHDPLSMLTASRFFIVLFGTIALLFAFAYAIRLIGLLPALIGFTLIAFDPFTTSLSRLLHPDSLLSIFMLLSTLAFLNYILNGHHFRDLVISGVVAGLSALTKTPAIFLLPLAGLLALLDVVIQGIRTRGWQKQPLVQARNVAGQVTLRVGLWLLIAIAVIFVLWPALWVAPLDTLHKVLDESLDYSIQGHSSPIFFNGRIYNGDPGMIFYPITYLWRATPLVLIGLVLALLAFILRSKPFNNYKTSFTAAGFALFAIFFFIFMGLSAKKFDRYLSPVYMPLDIVAALGWIAVAQWLTKLRPPLAARWAPPILLAGVVLVQAIGLVQTYPYYITYYNPLMGGPAKAPQVMFMGWGEGSGSGGALSESDG